VEIVAALVDDTLNCQVDVGLIEMVRRPVLETGPHARIVFEFGVYPYFRFSVALEWRVVQEIFFDERVFILVLSEWVFKFGGYVGRNCDERKGKHIHGYIFLGE
jgi:hypothetical protein